MKSYATLIYNALEVKKARGYDAVYWGIDLHDTIIEGKYNRNNHGANIYPYAREVIDFLFSHPDHRVILWTSSHMDPAFKAITDHKLKFHYLNENPECLTTDLCNFDKKFYFNIILDDKGGFEGHVDWLTIKQTLEEIYKIQL